MRPRIAFIHLGQLHDEYPDVADALLVLGVESEPLPLVQRDVVDWRGYAGINLRECRGFHLAPQFGEQIEDLAGRAAPLPLINPLAVVRGALDKSTYLPALAASGIPVVPTLWMSADCAWHPEDWFQELGCEDLVVKPDVSSKSWRTFRLIRTTGVILWHDGAELRPTRLPVGDCAGALQAAFPLGGFSVQRFMPDLLTRGELSFVFLGGTFSHAVRKTVASGGWLAHEAFGGRNTACEIDASQRAWAERAYAELVPRFGPLAYARIDAIPDGMTLRLLECELIVPRLFLREGQAVTRYAAVLKAALDRA